MNKFLCIVMSVFCLAVSGAGLGAVRVQNNSAEESRYALDFVQGGSLLEIEERDVYYATKDDTSDTYVNPYEAPRFIANKSNACAVQAGGNAIVYYDRLFDELIPDYKHKYVWGGIYIRYAKRRSQQYVRHSIRHDGNGTARHHDTRL